MIDFWGGDSIGENEKENIDGKGTLYLCATPIGNLEDITLRVLRIFKEADLIAAEDTRHTAKLLNHFEITTPLTSYHEHNKNSKGSVLIERLNRGENIALVTDAGMPGISDPGEDMVRLCYENDIPVTVCPGASAAVTALVLSGLPTRRFVFQGFLPDNKKQKADVLSGLKNEQCTIILYEAPHRLLETLNLLYKELGERNVSVIRELTKKFETVQIKKLSEHIEFYENNEPRGEFVLVIEGVSYEEAKQDEIEKWLSWTVREHVDYYINSGSSEKDAMKLAAKDRNVSKRDIYSEYKEIKKD